MSNIYEQMTKDEFEAGLESIVAKMSASEILSYGEVRAILGEELNNQVLEEWRKAKGLEENDYDTRSWLPDEDEDED